MWFIASLFTAVGAALLYRRTERTASIVAIACIPIVLTGLLVALIAAPWQIKLVVLVGLLSYNFTQDSVSS